jgi:hypothetical protein
MFNSSSRLTAARWVPIFFCLVGRAIADTQGACPNFSGTYHVSNPSGCQFETIINCGTGSDLVPAISRISFNAGDTVQVTQNACQSVTIQNTVIPFTAQDPSEAVEFKNDSFKNSYSDTSGSADDGVPMLGHKSSEWSITKNTDLSLKLAASCSDFGVIFVIPVHDSYSANCTLIP